MTSAILIFYVAEQEKSKAFYAFLLQQQPVLDVPGMTEFVISEQVKLGLMPENGIAKILLPYTPHPAEASGVPRSELYLYCENPSVFYNRALEAGALAISEALPRDWGDDVAYVADPDGHILAFAKKSGA